MPYIQITEARQRSEELKGKKFGPAYWAPERLTAQEMNLIADRIDIGLYLRGLREMQRIEMGYGNTQIKYVGVDKWEVHPNFTILYYTD